ncbi:uncharacterized protein B0H18DRAFT_977437, partial [Fomitopsis serialis]|uniref:uncharacterized protein n=1 Tax=Fomitopsis serialis TaxID=139415 RepID=UPI002007B3B7
MHNSLLMRQPSGGIFDIPLGHGFLTGQIKSIVDVPADDPRRILTRFKIQSQRADSRTCHPRHCGQEGRNSLAIAWATQLGPQVVPLPGMLT